jgi:RsiW-degrading membrane proteinase PrsW (M82 family)
VFYRVFCEVALTEEAGRFLVFLVFFRIAARFSGQPGSGAAPAPEFWGALAGLTAGIGFAVIENTSYGAADMGIAFIRAFTAAPLHGACGARVGVAVVNLRDPFSPLLHFSFAVAIHGMYDLMLLLGGIPWILAILVAFSAFASSILFIRAGFKSSTQSHG